MRHGTQSTLGIELVDVHVLDRFVGPNASRVDEAPPVTEPVASVLTARLVERRGATSLGETFAPGSDDFSEQNRNDHERERALQHRDQEARDRHAGGADHGELRRNGQSPESDEGADHGRERKQHEGVPGKGQEHELDRT